MTNGTENRVLIGNKPPEDYLIIAAKILRTYNEVYLLARGKNINKAVEVLERLKNELYGLKYTIETGTETLEGPDGKPKYVSFIKIHIFRERGGVFVPRPYRQATIRRQDRRAEGRVG